MDNENNSWKGYTLEQLRLQRIVVATKIELEKAKLEQQTAPLRGGNTLVSGRSMFSKIAGALDYADYAILAYNIGKRVFRLLRHRKR